MTNTSVTVAHDSPTAPRTLLPRLKNETREVHESLERDLDLLRPDLTLERYRVIVERFYGFYQPWEEALQPLLAEHLPDFAGPRSKLPKLREDLAFLAADPASVALCQALPDCIEWPQALGGLYVTEGATLGGQIISRHLEQTLGLSARRGAAFFSSYGLQVGAMWRAFCAILQTQTTAEQDEVVIASARQTFISIHDWLCEGE